MESTDKEHAVQEQIVQFTQLFPDVKGEEVPQEVWQAVHGGQSLALAYCLWRIRMLEEDARRRQRGEQLSAGSVSSAGSSVGSGTLAAFWDAYEM